MLRRKLSGVCNVCAGRLFRQIPREIRLKSVQKDADAAIGVLLLFPGASKYQHDHDSIFKLPKRILSSAGSARMHFPSVELTSARPIYNTARRGAPSESILLPMISGFLFSCQDSKAHPVFGRLRRSRALIHRPALGAPAGALRLRNPGCPSVPVSLSEIRRRNLKQLHVSVQLFEKLFWFNKCIGRFAHITSAGYLPNGRCLTDIFIV